MQINYTSFEKSCVLALPQDIKIEHIKSIQFSSVAQSCPTFCDPRNCNTPGLPVHHQLLEFTPTLVHRVGDTIQPSHPQCPLLLLPTIPPSIRVFSSESILRIRWPKYWSFSFGIIPSNEHLGVVSSSMDCLEFLAVQGPSQYLESALRPVLKC